MFYIHIFLKEKILPTIHEHCLRGSFNGTRAWTGWSSSHWYIVYRKEILSFKSNAVSYLPVTAKMTAQVWKKLLLTYHFDLFVSRNMASPLELPFFLYLDIDAMVISVHFLPWEDGKQNYNQRNDNFLVFTCGNIMPSIIIIYCLFHSLHLKIHLVFMRPPRTLDSHKPEANHGLKKYLSPILWL